MNLDTSPKNAFDAFAVEYVQTIRKALESLRESVEPENIVLNASDPTPLTVRYLQCSLEDEPNHSNTEHDLSPSCVDKLADEHLLRKPNDVIGRQLVRLAQLDRNYREKLWSSILPLVRKLQAHP